MRIIALVAFLLCGGHASADGCRTFYRPPVIHHAPVHHHVPTFHAPIVATFAFVPPATYQVGSSAQGLAVQQLLLKIDQLEQRLVQGGQPSTAPSGGPKAVEPQGVEARVTALMNTKCMACHSPTTKTKGGGHELMTADGNIAQGVDLFSMWLEVDEGRMPKGGGPLADEEKAAFKELLKAGIAAAKAQRQPAPQRPAGTP